MRYRSQYNKDENPMMKNKKEEEGKEKEVQSKTQEEAICRKKFKWPKKLQDPNPAVNK